MINLRSTYSRAKDVVFIFIHTQIIVVAHDTAEFITQLCTRVCTVYTRKLEKCLGVYLMKHLDLLVPHKLDNGLVEEHETPK